MQAPQLLYHSDSPPLYPTNTSSSLVTIRFPAPVQITSIRIIPEDVLSLDGIGTTYPSKWTGEIYLNVSDASPVNALQRRDVVFEGGDWPVEYEIEMPDDVTTRLVSLLAPVQSISLSIYGHNAAGPSNPASSPSQPAVMCGVGEDWSWVSSWAGGIGGLIGILDSSAEDSLKGRAMECLELLENGQEGIIPKILESEGAVSYVLTQSGFTSRLLNNPEYALHPTVRSTILPSHQLYDLISDKSTNQRRCAWQHLHIGRLPLCILARDEVDDLMNVEDGMDGSNLARLLDIAETYAAVGDKESGLCLAHILDILDNPPQDRLVLARLARVVPRWTAIANILNGSQRVIDLPSAYALPIAQSLLSVSTEVIGTILAFPMAQTLIQPFLDHLPPDSPYHSTFALSPVPPTSPHHSADADARRLARLSSALSARCPSAKIHTATPAELINLLAPNLFAILSTAPVPLLDIASALANPTPESQASAWAGKVYSSNEFREREEARVGLGIKVTRTAGLAVLGGGPGSVGSAGLERGDSSGRISRPASRHVDDFA